MTLTKEEVLERILIGRPLSLARCGDGEKLILDSQSGYSEFKLASEAVLRRQMGVDPTVREVEEIRDNLILAYTGCDILGLPMQKNLNKLSSHWTKVEEVLNENVPKHTEVYCSIDVAYEWLEDGSYDRLLGNRKVLNYISCRDLDEGFKRKWNIDTVNKFTIAPEAKFTSGYEGDRHYPTQFNRVSRWMEVVLTDFPKSLLLVGAGVIGKIYCNWWRDKGGIAVDVGAVLDIFAGKITRGPERGLDKDDLDSTYKL